MAFLTSGLFQPLLQTMKKEIPMRVYRQIQTGLNIQLGGENEGFANAVNQVGIAGMVKKDPTKPANWQRAVLATNLIIFINTSLNRGNHQCFSLL
jgi:hypothetical protein